MARGTVVPGTWRDSGARSPSQVRTAAIPSHDSAALLDGGQHPGGKGHDCPFGSHHRTGRPRSREVGDCKPAMLAGRCSSRSFHVKAGRFLVREPIVCPTGRPEVGDVRTCVHEGDGCYHLQTAGVRASPKAFYASRSGRPSSKEATQGSSKEKRWERTNQRGRTRCC